MGDFGDDVDFRKIGKELTTALAKDEKYQRENDAKFRAINQKVQSYDEFRDIVEASHLRPLDKQDKLGGMSYQTWNSVSDGKNVESNPRDEAEHNIQKQAFSPPKTGQEFIRVWKRNCPTPNDKFSYLLSINRNMLQTCFAAECPVGEIVSTISACDDLSMHSIVIVEILEIMTRSKRFCLELDFLNKSECASLHSLTQGLIAYFGKKEDLENVENMKKLMQLYRI